MHYIKGEFGAGVPIYWMGSYGGLEVQDFVLEVWSTKLLRAAKKKCEYRCSLSNVAQGSIQQVGARSCPARAHPAQTRPEAACCLARPCLATSLRHLNSIHLSSHHNHHHHHHHHRN